MLPPVYVTAQQAPPSQNYVEGLTVTAPRQVVDVEHRTVEYSGGVTAVYGPTRVTTERLVLHGDPDDPYGEAVGNVKLTDPEGTVTAGDLIFHWKTQIGSGHTVSVKVSSLSLTADSIDIKPGLWTLRNVGGTGCALKPPLYFIHTRELQVKPGESVRVIRPELSVFGHRLLTLPTKTYSLTDSGGSIDLPYPTYRSERGWGINWTNSLPIGFDSALFTRYAVFQKSLPFYDGTLMHSFIAGRDPEVVRTEIGDRFSFGYFDNVQVREPASERLYLSKRRMDAGLSSTFGADARDTTTSEDKINKPIEAIGHASGAFAGFAAYGLFRAQEVRVGSGPTVDRLLLEGNVLSPELRLGNKLSAYGRADFAQYTGGNSYGWLRGQAGLVFEATPNVRLGASFTTAKDHGIPDFAYDVPSRSRELAFRTDFDFDTTQLRVLVKVDPVTHGIFDREFYLSQVVGCIEPYVVYRERPHKFFVGIKLPIGRVFNRLRDDLHQRGNAVRQAAKISG